MDMCVSPSSRETHTQTLGTVSSTYTAPCCTEYVILYTSDFFISRPLIGRAIGIVNLYEN